MNKLEQLSNLIEKVKDNTFKTVLEAQLNADALPAMQDFVFGALLYCPAENTDYVTIIQLLAALKD